MDLLISELKQLKEYAEGVFESVRCHNEDEFKLYCILRDVLTNIKFRLDYYTRLKEEEDGKEKKSRK